MTRARLAGAFAALVIASLGLAVWTAPLAAQTPPPPGSGRLLWTTDSDLNVGYGYGTIKVDAIGGEVLLDIGHSAKVEAVAADGQRGVVWTYAGSTLRAFGFDGTLQRSIAMSLSRMALDATDGSLWVGVGTTLQHLDAQGQSVLTAATDYWVSGLAVDPARGRVWVATGEAHLHAYNYAGQLVQTVNLGLPSGRYLYEIAVDPDTGQLWAATTDELRRYSPQGTLELTVPLEITTLAVRWLGPDGAGGTWVAGISSLRRVGPAGEVLVQISPWPTPAGRTHPPIGSRG